MVEARRLAPPAATPSVHRPGGNTGNELYFCRRWSFTGIVRGLFPFIMHGAAMERGWGLIWAYASARDPESQGLLTLT